MCCYFVVPWNKVAVKLWWPSTLLPHVSDLVFFFLEWPKDFLLLLLFLLSLIKGQRGIPTSQRTIVWTSCLPVSFTHRWCNRQKVTSVLWNITRLLFSHVLLYNEQFLESTTLTPPARNPSELPPGIICKWSKVLLIALEAERRRFMGETKCEDCVDFPSRHHGAIQTAGTCTVLVDLAWNGCHAQFSLQISDSRGISLKNFSSTFEFWTCSSVFSLRFGLEWDFLQYTFVHLVRLSSLISPSPT